MCLETIFLNKNLNSLNILNSGSEDCLEQRAHPCALILVLPEIIEVYECPLGHNHHTFLLLPLTTSEGFNFPFLVGCHSLAIFGDFFKRLFSFVTFLFLQNGQPDEFF